MFSSITWIEVVTPLCWHPHDYLAAVEVVVGKWKISSDFHHQSQEMSRAVDIRGATTSLTLLFVLEFLPSVQQLRTKTSIEVLPDASDDLHGNTPLPCRHLLPLQMVEILLNDVINWDLGWELEQLLLMDHQVPVIHQNILQLLGNINAILVVDFVV